MGNFKSELSNYQNVPRELVFDKDLSDRARFVYVFMACKPDNWDFYLEPMAKDIGYSVDTLRKYINELVTSGWLIKGEQTNENGVFGAVEYTLKATKISDTEFFRHGNNQPQINKDIKEIKTETIKEKEDTIISSKKKYSLDLSIVAPEMREAVDLWLAYKKEKGQTYKPTGFKTFYNNLIKLSDNNPMLAMRIVEKSMQNNYAGIFALRDWEKETILRDLPTQQQDMPTNNDMVINGQIYR